MTPLPPPVSALERRLGIAEGSLTAEDLARGEEALADATANALAEVGTQAATAWQTSAPAVVTAVVLKAARREFENPQGYESQGVGEVSGSVAVASGAELTDSEIARVRRAAGIGRGFVGSVRTPSAYETPTSSADPLALSS